MQEVREGEGRDGEREGGKERGWEGRRECGTEGGKCFQYEFASFGSHFNLFSVNAYTCMCMHANTYIIMFAHEHQLGGQLL